MIPEWSSQSDRWLIGAFDPFAWVWERPLVCCLCLQEMHFLDSWTILGCGEKESTFTFCDDCRTLYDDEPLRAHLEAAEWIATIDRTRRPAGGP